MILRGLFQP